MVKVVECFVEKIEVFGDTLLKIVVYQLQVFLKLATNQRYFLLRLKLEHLPV